MQTSFFQLLLLLLATFSLSAQEPVPNAPSQKGVTLISSPSAGGGGQEGATYALVVGISDYQDEGIPDLQYAHRDAQAFANFLRSPAGGQLDEDHLKLLTNEQATTGQMVAAMDWLIDVCEERDQAIIYFSGHGDVEQKTAFNLGFLLTWDSPPQAYAAGAFHLYYLKAVVSTLATEKKARITVITDACRAGKLAGTAVGGTQITGSNLAQQYANEIKILSCQPEEYSLEGEQWGGGRGAFSYHLIDGLYGLADRNGDGTVNLMEIRGYLEERVSEEVAPESQLPMTVGNSREELARVYPELLEKVRQDRQGQLQLFTGTESRGIVEEVLAEVDTSIRKTYYAFQQALDENRFLNPEDACADAYYEQLIAEPALARLHNSLRRNYAAALQDEAQQVMNTMLKSGLTEQILKGSKLADLYKDYPAYLERAAELLGEEHYMYCVLKARKLFFEGMLGRKRKEKRQRFRTALQLQPNMVHAMVELIRNSEAKQLDSATFYFNKATSMIPSWVEPYVAMSDYYRDKIKDFDQAIHFLNVAEKIDSNSVLIWYKKARFYNHYRQNYEEAEKYYQKVIDGAGKDICFPCAYIDFGWSYQANQRYEEAEKMYKAAIQLDPDSPNPFTQLGDLYLVTERYELAEEYFKKAIQLDSTHAFTYRGLGITYFQNQRYKEAEKHLLKATESKWNQLNKPFLEEVYRILGLLYFQTARYEKAEQSYKKAIQLDSTKTTSYYELAIFYFRSRRYEEAEKQFRKILQMDSTDVVAYYNLGIVYQKMMRYPEAEQQFKKVIQLDDSKNAFAFYNLACIKSLQGELEKAYAHLDSALIHGFENYDHLQEDSDLAPLREDAARWQALMQRYFPERSKE